MTRVIAPDDLSLLNLGLTVPDVVILVSEGADLKRWRDHEVLALTSAVSTTPDAVLLVVPAAPQSVVLPPAPLTLELDVPAPPPRRKSPPRPPPSRGELLRRQLRHGRRFAP